MIKLLIIADDFTGALDTGVQFASRGISTRVIVEHEDGCWTDSDAVVLVIDAETRHLPGEQAYKLVYCITKQAVDAGIPYLYKKTDSALRGNIGSELTAFLRASGEGELPFLPAFPQMNRVVKGGVLYIDGVPVSESVFGRDPFEPVTKSGVREIIAQQSGMCAENIIVYDTETREDMEEILKGLKQGGRCRILAGCAGCAQLLPEILELEGSPRKEISLPGKLLVMCGSVNPITRRQLDYGERQGMKRIYFSNCQKLVPSYWESEEGRQTMEMFFQAARQNRCLIIDSNDSLQDKPAMEYAREQNISLEEMRKRIAESMGAVTKQMLALGVEHLLFMTGGDTLFGFMNAMQMNELEPLWEISPGCVLTKFTYGESPRYVISKSGGFGPETLLEDIISKLPEEEENEKRGN